MAAVPVLLLSRYLAMNSGYRKYFATVEGGAGNSDKGAGKNSDALLSELVIVLTSMSMKHAH